MVFGGLNVELSHCNAVKTLVHVSCVSRGVLIAFYCSHISWLMRVYVLFRATRLYYRD
jgi:hypothetical protein